MKCHPEGYLRRALDQTVPESAIQRATVQLLRLRGYVVLETSEHRRAIHCPHCHKAFTPTEGRGSTPGVPDLIVAMATAPELGWCGVEMKGAKTKVTEAQRELAAMRLTFICRSPEEALAAVAKYFRGEL